MSAPDIGDPRAAARALLALADPLPTLTRWDQGAAGPRLGEVLHAVAEELRAAPRPVSPLQQVSLELGFGDRSTRLELLLLPSIFFPEAWSLTFLEGLLRKPLWQYEGRTLIELGTGSGWISLALLRFTGLRRAIGLDLNPQAVLMARLNAALNGIPSDRFEAYESDLLEEPRRRGQRADLIVGCIPQVITPEVDLHSTQGLHDLSNYTVAQGLVEDRFGLGLNARALREAVGLLQPGGSVILNLAGRPGSSVVSGMFRRRGFEPEMLWRARVEQAADTDISALVELEARSGQLFAFHLHRHSSESVSARVAKAVLDGERSIFHELQVIEGRLRSEALVRLAGALSTLGLSQLWEQIDLSSAIDEQLRFVTRLAEGFARAPRAPYPHEAGDRSFRRRVTDFLRKFHDLPLDPEDVFVGPDRQQVVYGLLLCRVKPGQPVMVSASLREVYAPIIEAYGADPIWVHDDVEELVELVPLLEPRLVILAPPAAWRGHREALRELLEACERNRAQLCLDESDRFEITSRRAESPVLDFLSEHLDSPHLLVFFGLVRSQAFPDAHLAMLLTRQRTLHAGLEAVAEVTYSRISYFTQAYYDSLFDELLSFRVNTEEPAPAAPPRRPELPLRPAMAELLRAPAFARPPPAPDVIRLDYGENELELPRRLMAGILRGFLVPPKPAAGAGSMSREAKRAAREYLQATRLPTIEEQQVMLGQGTLPLLFDAMRALGKMLGRGPRVLLPQGSFGIIPPLLITAGCELITLPTREPDFLATPERVAQAGAYDALLLTHPANPSGASYPPEVLRALIQRSAAAGARVVLDEVFGMLADLDGPLPVGQDRLAGLSPEEAQRVLVVCGASKEFAAGGLRLGIAATKDEAWLRGIRALRMTPVPRHVQVAAAALLSGFREHRGELEAMRASLRGRRDQLAAGLRRLGFGVSEAHRGGLFLLADVSPLAEGDPDGFVLRLEQEARVRLNTPNWSGLTRHARACFAISEERIDEALARMERFLAGARRG